MFSNYTEYIFTLSNNNHSLKKLNCMKSYSQLNIHQKINAKASALNYGLSFGALTLGWYPMKADFIVFDLAPFRTDKVYTFKRK